MVEALKQVQYAPLPVEKQVLLIYAVTNGYVDDYSVEVIGKYEKELFVHLEVNHADMLTEIREKKVIDDTLKEKVNSALDSLKEKLGELQ